jgi:Zn-finger nucleic acid-binding protein
MHCPFCENTLIPFEEHHLHLDRCPNGHGIWFDGGELEAYKKKYPDTEKAPREETHQFQPLPGEAVKDCPRCRRKTLEAGRLYELNVHHCFTCHGVFLGQPTNIDQETHDSAGLETLEGVQIGTSIIEAIISTF